MSEITRLFLTSLGVVVFLIMLDATNVEQTTLSKLITAFINVIFLLSEIATVYCTLLGTIGDVIFFMYMTDMEIERVYYRNNNYTSSCPEDIKKIYKKLTINRVWDGGSAKAADHNSVNSKWQHKPSINELDY